MIDGKVYKVYTYLSQAITRPSNPGVIEFLSIRNSRFSTTTYLLHHCLPGTLISNSLPLNLVLEYSPFFFINAGVSVRYHWAWPARVPFSPVKGTGHLEQSRMGLLFQNRWRFIFWISRGHWQLWFPLWSTITVENEGSVVRQARHSRSIRTGPFTMSLPFHQILTWIPT